MDTIYCWHDGDIKPVSEVQVSILDFGFIHCDATYDVMRVINGEPCFFDKHIARYSAGCERFGFKPTEHIKNIVRELHNVNPIEDAFLWIIEWRGSPPSGSPRDGNTEQHTAIYLKPYYPINTHGVSLCIAENTRRIPDVCYGQQYKNFAWIDLTMAQREADDKNVDSALLLSVDGERITEGPGFGVCFVKDGEVLTPRKDCLGSVTIDVVAEICDELDIPFNRCDITLENTRSADECMVCSTSGGVTPVTMLSERKMDITITTKIVEKYNERLENGI